MNDGLLVRIKSLLAETIAAEASAGPEGVESYITGQIITLREKVPDFENPKALKDGEQPSEDHMIISLLSQVVNAVTKLIQEGKAGVSSRGNLIVEEIKEHERRLVERQEQIVQEIIIEEKEQRKFITSDDLHMGFESKTVSSCSV